MLGYQTLLQVPDDKLFWKFNESSDSIAIIVKHLNGNMLSRWMQKEIYIRNQGHTVVEAINRQLEAGIEMVEASVSFYAADQPGSNTVIVEGSDMNGNLGRKVFKLRVGVPK